MQFLQIYKIKIKKEKLFQKTKVNLLRLPQTPGQKVNTKSEVYFWNRDHTICKTKNSMGTIWAIFEKTNEKNKKNFSKNLFIRWAIRTPLGDIDNVSQKVPITYIFGSCEKTCFCK